MRFYLALWAAKATQLLLKLLGKKATYFAGKIAIRLCPDFIGRIGKPKTILGVTGTNGKTTVSNLLTDMLEHMGVSVLSNRYGSNINAGVATALLSGANLFGRTKKQLAVLEIDERSAKLVYPYLQPDFLVITNLFRDSMRRNAHAEYIADFLTGSIPKGTKLVLNADDLISSAVAPENESVTFGIAPLHGEPPPRDSIVCDARVCPACGSSLTYDFRRYNHIGRAHCPGCGFHSPEPDYRIASVDFDAGTAVLEEQGAFYPYKLNATMLYNLYNFVAAIAALRQLSFEHTAISSALEHISVVESRFKQDQIKNKTLSVIMAKGLNAVACSRSFDYVGNENGKKAVILMLDDVFDEKHSSENIAWLYDADFEFLNTPDVLQIIPVGVRNSDSLLRLLIAGIPKEKVTAVPDGQSAADAVDLSACDKIYVLYELYRYDVAMKTRDRIAQRIKEEVAE